MSSALCSPDADSGFDEVPELFDRTRLSQVLFIRFGLVQLASVMTSSPRSNLWAGHNWLPSRQSGRRPEGTLRRSPPNLLISNIGRHHDPGNPIMLASALMS